MRCHTSIFVHKFLIFNFAGFANNLLHMSSRRLEELLRIVAQLGVFPDKQLIINITDFAYNEKHLAKEIIDTLFNRLADVSYSTSESNVNLHYQCFY